MTLTQFFEENPSVALAFSGGVDSAYLLYAAVKAGIRVRAYYVRTEFQPEFEYEDACLLAKQLGADMKTIPLEALTDGAIAANPTDRCYYCKKRIFTAITEAAARDGFTVLTDGTNASDDLQDRPGVRALRELHVRSPLLEAGLTKPEIRELSRQAGLFTHDKPAYACLATRIPSGRAITKDLLEKTEASENDLRALGFSDFRIRLFGDCARIQLREEQLPLLLEHRQTILKKLKTRYSGVLLDLEVRSEQ